MLHGNSSQLARLQQVASVEQLYIGAALVDYLCFCHLSGQQGERADQQRYKPFDRMHAGVGRARMHGVMRYVHLYLLYLKVRKIMDLYEK